MNVAALYIDPRGPYPEIADRLFSNPHSSWDLDCWDESRDARKYDGPYPVVAHPPCGPWGRLRHLYRGSEHDCAPRAVEQVRRWGGVLEHPAGSLLWRHCGLPVPDFDVLDGARLSGKISRISTMRDDVGEFVDSHGGWGVEVDQVEWGHVARKRTWLYLVGVPREALERPPFPGRKPTHWISGGRGRAGKKAKTTPVPPGIKVCSAQQRRRTPPLFAEYLIRLARSVKR